MKKELIPGLGIGALMLAGYNLGVMHPIEWLYYSDWATLGLLIGGLALVNQWVDE